MKKSTPVVFGENIGKVFEAPWAELGKTIGKRIGEQEANGYGQTV